MFDSVYDSMFEADIANKKEEAIMYYYDDRDIVDDGNLLFVEPAKYRGVNISDQINCA